MIDRRHFLKTMGFGMFSLASFSHLEGYAESNRIKKPNILLILVDDMGWSDIAAIDKRFRPDSSSFSRLSCSNVAATPGEFTPLAQSFDVNR